MVKKLLKDERGSAIIIFTLGLTVFFGFLAFVADTGLLYYKKADLANAVDAAALAGAQELPYKPQTAVDKAVEYGTANGLIANNLVIQIFDSNKKIKVSSQKDINLLFAKILGIDSGRVGHTATAQVASIVGVNGAAPLGIQKHDFVFGQQYTLKVGAGDTSNLTGEISPGWFGALALGGPGASTYEDNLSFGYDGNLKIGDLIDIQTGNISGPTKDAIDYRISQDKHTPYCTVDHFERDCSRLIKVPVIEAAGHKTVKILGFSMFLIDDVTGQGNDSYVKGKFVRTIAVGEIDPDSQDYGLLGIKLVE
ncbi:MAG: TadE/TadG family type IV pilus assembly protein [Bacillota bacterium]